MDQIRILVADSHLAVRKQIAARLQREPDFEVVAEAGDAAETLGLVRSTRPHIVLIDPDGIGIESIEKIMEKIMAGDRNIRVIVLTAIADTDTRIKLVKAGVHWILAKELNTSQLVNTLHQMFNTTKTEH